MSDTVPIATPSISPHPEIAGDDLWVFAYGSLMWRPDFEYAERVPALLRGVHRALCIYSTRYRGTPENPGVVLGLDHGGSCQGIAYRIATSHVAATREYLTGREMVNRVYREVMRPTRLQDGRIVSALAYIADRRHSQYARGLDRDRIVELVRHGHGIGGACLDYVVNTLASLTELGIDDHALAWLSQALDADSPRS